MAELKTRPTNASVEDHIDGFADEIIRDDARAICRIMKSMTGKPAVLWGTAIIGFDTYQYNYADGKEFSWPVLAFAIRKNHLTVYLVPGFKDSKNLFKKLGKFKLSGGCLHFKTLGDLNLPAFKAVLKASQTGLKHFLAERKKRLAKK